MVEVMLLSNFHMHCHYCDGKGSPQEMFEKANRLGFVSVGFSSHAPLPFDNDFCMHADKLDAYIEEISALKGHAETQVYLGLELDFIPAVTTPSHQRWEGLPLDYKIGSVHTLEAPNDRYPMLSVDGPHDEFLVLLNEVHGGSARSMITKYYQRVTELCELGGFDILGHFDLIKKHNKALGFFDESEDWYKGLALDALDAVAQSGVILEVNYGGMLRGATDDVYPSPWLLEEAKQRNIPIQINADAHAPHHLGVHHEHCQALLKRLGYDTQRILMNGVWTDVAL